MTAQSTEILLKSAAADHLAGRCAQAEAAYRQVLGVRPDHPEALHGLGLVARTNGRPGEAIDWIRRAITANGKIPRYHLNLGVILAEQNRLEEAISSYQTALRLKPKYAGALSNFGDALRRLGRLPEAIDACRQATVLQPDMAEAFRNLAIALRVAGQPGPAAAALEQALELQPDNALALAELGAALMEDQAVDAAIVALRRALYVQPALADAHANLAAALVEIRQYEQAAASARTAIALDPNLIEGHTNLGIALCLSGRTADSIAVLHKALELQRTHLQTLTSLGNAHHDQGDYAAAIQHYENALAIKPDHPTANWNLGLCLLVQGDFEHGWPRYQWRWKLREFRGRTNPDRPLWDGSALAGKRILLHTEQGFGDAIQFIRYVPLVAARGGQIIVVCHDELRRLFEQSGYPVQQWLLPNDRLPAFDVHAPLMSLPGIFKTTVDTIPAAVPYLKSGRADRAHWHARLAAFPGRRIGLAWAGRPSHAGDRRRSISIEQFAPLAALPDTSFFSLQIGPAAAQLAHAPLPITDLSPDLRDFADTAAVIDDLDAVVCVDTAVAHLAGALAKPVRLLLPYVPDWRWMLARNDSPWYPTVKLFRQQRPGDWTSPVENVVAELKAHP